MLHSSIAKSNYIIYYKTLIQTADKTNEVVITH